METRAEGTTGSRLTGRWTQVAAVILLVLALRLPFLNQAIQGDDVYYLYAAEHAQIDPAHPQHGDYLYLGQRVSMRGHPHPPLNSWALAALLAVVGDVREVPFHAAYILFSILAAISALSIARRFSSEPLLAAVLFLVTPAFVINGTSLEADLPFVAFWLAAVALFIRAVDRKSAVSLAIACITMALAALTAYQAVVLTPILFLYAWRSRTSRWRPPILATLTPLVAIGLFQAYERLSSGALPASVLAGYLQTYEVIAKKILNGVALTVHLGWIIFPVIGLLAFWRRTRILIPVMIAAAIYDRNPLFWICLTAGVAVLLYCVAHWRDFLAQWVLVFFAAALILFFAGSARYLLPIALPVAILFARRMPRKLITEAIIGQGALGILLAIVNYQHWDGYRQFAATLAGDATSKRVWIDGEWGMRYYLEAEGALPLERSQAVRPGDMVVSSDLAYPFPIVTRGGVAATVSEREITSPIPLRLVGLDSRSAYSSAGFGLRPFDNSIAPIDRVRVQTVVERSVTLQYLPMNAPESAWQIASGIYALEDNRYRWISRRGVLLLKSPASPAPIDVHLYIPGNAPARTVTVSLDGRPLKQATFERPGVYTLTTDAAAPSGPTATLTIAVDKTFSVPGDGRELGMILTEAGFRK